MKEFTTEELKKYNGVQKKEVYIAFQGIIYDLSGSFLWKNGKHQVSILAGLDLTKEIKKAPHNKDLLEGFPKIGILI